MERRDLSGEFSQNTQLRYRRCFKAVSRHIGKAEVALITPEMIEDMYAAMRQGDTLSGKAVERGLPEPDQQGPRPHVPRPR